MELLTKFNEFVAGFAPGLKTNLNTLILVVVSLYASTKGLDAEALTAWVNEGLASVNSLIVLLGGLSVWFRKLAVITETKKLTSAQDKARVTG
mgnify:CR=1 FL=1